ncbi:hypothetical protein C8R43DRAFT_894905 [Mycena crocata]|nr:hypothetical protein C8R43DRAFT_894905 [Mycena crocata]
MVQPDDFIGRAEDRLVNEFCRFLTEAAQIHRGRFSGGSKFQEELCARKDYLLPFRELGPSRQHIVCPDGPFTPERIRTNAGMLSALIFRGVTFGTEFMFNYPTFFTSIEDFHRVKDIASAQYLEKHGEAAPERYFCFADTYGPHNSKKLVNLADDYAAALEIDSWEAMLNGRDRIPFLECFNWLSGFRGKKIRRFPVLGPLASYLLTADLFYAGVVEEPTVEVMGEVIATLNKGAAQGLQLLNLIPPRVTLKKTWRKTSTTNATQGFRQLYQKVLARLPPDILEWGGFDVIVLEHSLCKFSRCHKKGWYRMHST